MQPPVTSPYMTTKDLAALWKVSTRTIKRMHPILPAPIRIGRSLRWHKDKILRWEMNHRERFSNAGVQ